MVLDFINVYEYQITYMWGVENHWIRRNVVGRWGDCVALTDGVGHIETEVVKT